LFLLLGGWRLWVAYLQYMQFPDAAPTILASEFILLLVFGVVTLRYVATALLT